MDEITKMIANSIMNRYLENIASVNDEACSINDEVGRINNEFEQFKKSQLPAIEALSERQEKLIDALSEFGDQWTKELKERVPVTAVTTNDFKKIIKGLNDRMREKYPISFVLAKMITQAKLESGLEAGEEEDVQTGGPTPVQGNGNVFEVRNKVARIRPGFKLP